MQNTEEITPSVVEKLRELLEKAPFGALTITDLAFLRARESYLTEEEKALCFGEEKEEEESIYASKTVAELKAICVERKIVIADKAKKAEIIAAIEAAEVPAE